MNGIKNKKVLITGASLGIGASIAEQFAKQKANVGLHYCNNEKKALELTEKLSKFTKIKLYKQDFLSDQLDLIHRFVKDFGTIDILINNAGIIDSKSFLDLEIEDYDNIFRINSRAPFMLSKDAFKYMQKNKFGRIINISSFVVKFGKGRNDSIQYAATKATLEVLTTGLAKIGAKHNILVNSIRPGIIMTDLQKNRKDIKKRLMMIPLRRGGNVEDISNLVTYLASEKGNFITGQVFTVSGGE